MKISSFQVPVTLKRIPGSNDVEVILHENEKVHLSDENLSAGSSTQIPNIAKELADGNNTQLTLVKGTMLAREQEAKAHVVFKYLT